MLLPVLLAFWLLLVLWLEIPAANIAFRKSKASDCKGQQTYRGQSEFEWAQQRCFSIGCKKHVNRFLYFFKTFFPLFLTFDLPSSFKSCKSETLMAFEQFMIVGPSHARKDENDGKSSKERGAGARSGTGGATTQTYWIIMRPLWSSNLLKREMRKATRKRAECGNGSQISC